ncbi:MAG: hypothetical protein ACHQ0J_15355 [Candidatus Dormibacterales bacterium]
MNPSAPEKMLMDEVALRARKHGGNYVAAWREVLQRPQKSSTPYAITRQAALSQVKLSEAQKGVVKLSDNARSAPGSSISKIRPTPGVAATTPPAERKPGESQEDFRQRLRQQVLDLGKPANAPRMGQKGAAADTATYGEPVGGYEYAKRKGELMANENAKDLELASHIPPVYKDTSSLRDKAMAYMKTHGVSYKVALSEVGK